MLPGTPPDEPGDDGLVLPGTPWLPEDPALPDVDGLPDDPEDGLPEEPDDGEELGSEGMVEDVLALMVAQPASANAPASAAAIPDHDSLRDIWLDSVAGGRGRASRCTPDTPGWIPADGRWFNATRRPAPPRRPSRR